MVSASYSGTLVIYNKTDEREIWRKNVAGTQKVDLPPGDGKASVSATRGFKHWFSTREAGLTVEATMQVSLTCGQKETSIMAAGEEAGRIAETMALQGIEEMDMHIAEFQKDINR